MCINTYMYICVLRFLYVVSMLCLATYTIDKFMLLRVGTCIYMYIHIISAQEWKNRTPNATNGSIPRFFSIAR